VKPYFSSIDNEGEMPLPDISSINKKAIIGDIKK